MIRWSEAACYVVVVVLAAFGLAAAGRRSVAAIYALPLGYFAVIHSVFVGSVRYRQPAVLAACVLAGLGAAQVLVLWRERKRRTAMTENGGRP